LRRGRFGRRLIALRDSPAASETLGLSVARTKLAVFTLSAGMAGLGGALYSGLRRTIGPDDFQMFMSLPILVLAVVGGVTTVVGPLFGGMFLAVLPWIGESRAALGNLAKLAPGLVGIGLGRNPDGVVAEFATQRARLRGDDADAAREVALDGLCAPGTDPGTPIDPAQVPVLDQELDLDLSQVPSDAEVRGTEVGRAEVGA
jgi:branched-chain amino acid transport system permease protein